MIPNGSHISAILFLFFVDFLFFLLGKVGPKASLSFDSLSFNLGSFGFVWAIFGFRLDMRLLFRPTQKMSNMCHLGTFAMNSSNSLEILQDCSAKSCRAFHFTIFVSITFGSNVCECTSICRQMRYVPQDFPFASTFMCVSGHFRPLCAEMCQHNANTSGFEHNCAKISEIRPQIGQLCPYLGHFGLKSANLGHIWPNLGNFSEKNGKSVSRN